MKDFSILKMKNKTDLVVSSHVTDETEITLVAMEIFLPGSNPAVKNKIKNMVKTAAAC